MTSAATPDFYWLGFEAYGRGETIDRAPGGEESAERLDWIDGWEFGKFASAADPDPDDLDAAEPPLLAAAHPSTPQDRLFCRTIPAERARGR
ncbi:MULTISPECIES: hypothetical protein [Methylobacterium]|uniref:Uncharacterized protein n=1 Tax=Methylobacterium bullatum TaxID=570505 RepID=A0A679K6T3_9HYPH|nr:MULTISPECIES: hypothetical protein [Methylobacterium]KQO43516.1 hypothetical protein ASF08_09165 [Methylobacterium sp. Leaf85]MBD8902338.1 hypothetical protein [Methylobacterium bullatum]GJD41409.1 hypothetical protein OICFNHDK_3892 [Methylobacterium bullatum]CAA2144067.1 hypothetical protein MBLL_03185 [Methylobacterium bullatum]